MNRCLVSILRQSRVPDRVLVIDNASQSETAAILARYPQVEVHRLACNTGGAGGFRAGIARALEGRPDFVWLMDDDGEPADPDCLAALVARATADAADIIAPAVLDDAEPDRLAFPVRLGHRTVFDAATLARHGPVAGFAHLFNGAMMRACVFTRIGLPDARFFIRGDEVEFLYRARAAGLAIVLDPQARFLHPGSRPEIHPILLGVFYAVVPCCETKQFYLFRNRAFIFATYGMWGFLAADVVRYGSYFLLNRRGDIAGLRQWGAATVQGLRGHFMASREIGPMQVQVREARL